MTSEMDQFSAKLNETVAKTHRQLTEVNIDRLSKSIMTHEMLKNISLARGGYEDLYGLMVRIDSDPSEPVKIAIPANGENTFNVILSLIPDRSQIGIELPIESKTYGLPIWEPYRAVGFEEVFMVEEGLIRTKKYSVSDSYKDINPLWFGNDGIILVRNGRQKVFYVSYQYEQTHSFIGDDPGLEQIDLPFFQDALLEKIATLPEWHEGKLRTRK